MLYNAIVVILQWISSHVNSDPLVLSEPLNVVYLVYTHTFSWKGIKTHASPRIKTRQNRVLNNSFFFK